MKFEDFSAPRTQRAETFHGIYPELLNNAYSKADAILRREAVDPKSFDDIFSREEIEADLQRTRERSKDFEQGRLENSSLHKASYAAEALILEQIGLSGWLSTEGVKVYVEKTSESDDIFNKTDLVLTFEIPGLEEPLAITVDVTIGVQALSEKIHSIKQEIDMRTLAKVKYHETLTGEHTSLDQTPRVLIGIDPSELKQLFTLWTSAEKAIKDRLKVHPIQRTIVYEIEEQLLAYQKYATDRGDVEMAENYKGLIEIFKKIKEGKDTQFEDKEEFESKHLDMLRTALRSQLSIARQRFVRTEDGPGESGS